MPAPAEGLKNLSLRTRLVLATLTLLALGLVAANAATYALLRSSLIARVDEQLDGARAYATRALFERAAPPELFSPQGFAGSRGRHEAQPVTYVELLDGSGRLVASRSFGFGSAGARPALPQDLPGSADGAGSERIFTARAVDGSSLRYRALATSLGRGQGTIVVAFQLRDADATLRRLLLVEGIVTVAVLGAATALALWLVKLGLRPLTQIEHTAAGIAAGDLSRRVEPSDGRTEVGRLGLALNAMLERIEAAFAQRQASESRLRRFVADASHELRTPLTSIRGYAELFRRGADARPEDLEKSMRRIEEESGRMGTLVEELLLLARLDQGRKLERGPVDLADVAGDAVQDARAVEPGRPIDIDATGPIVVEGDEARLRQVATNLIANALQHTPPGTPVHVRVARAGDEATLEVADEGPGLAEDDAAKVFDRFFRVDQARARGEGGIGLGLSIVAAIVHAHDGRVAVETAPGAGARFVVTLPVTARAIDSA